MKVRLGKERLQFTGNWRAADSAAECILNSKRSKNEFLRIMDGLIKSSSIEGIILGCTEIF